MTVERETALPIVSQGPSACSCGAHAEVAADLGRFASLPKGHVLRTLVEEHANLLKLLDELEGLLEAIGDRTTWSDSIRERSRISGIVERLIAAEPHHTREERVLFVRMGERGVVGPPAVMAREHDLLRALEGRLHELVKRTAGDFRVFKRELTSTAGSLAASLREHIFKENNVLYPYALRVIDDPATWARMKAECDAIGYCCATPTEEEP